MQGKGLGGGCYKDQGPHEAKPILVKLVVKGFNEFINMVQGLPWNALGTREIMLGNIASTYTKEIRPNFYSYIEA